VVANVNALLERATLNPREWEAFANFETHRYTRNVVAVDPAFVVLLLCWDSGQSSAIHDHSGSSCWVKVLSGALDEQRFAAGTMEPLGASERAEAGAVTYMHDSRGLHAISNASSRRAVSLHVYSPRFESCRIF
ncbi:RmlC-like cupin domain-containing protein, partial [Pelagophyceae sp. CCMP2097]